MKLRLTSDVNELKNCLKSFDLSQSCLVWKMVSSKREVVSLKAFEIDASDLVLKLYKPDQCLFQTNDEIYIKLGTSNISFKAKITAQSASILVAKVSSDLVMPEYRSHDRIKFKKTDQKKIYLQSAFADFSKDKNIYEAPVRDVSLFGTGISVDSSFGQKLKKHSKLLIRAMGDYQFASPMEVEVVNIRKIASKSNSLTGIRYEVGLQFSSFLPRDIYESFILKVDLPKLNENDFFLDADFKATVQNQISTIVTSLKKKPRLSQFLKSLEIKREGNQYLKNHIDLMCTVTTGLARFMEWRTDKTLSKLIYACYIHDSAYFNYPELARIKSKREFESLKTTLSPEAQAIYLQGPRIVSEFEKEDGFYNDLDKILIQQKERPDGSGFPYGIKHSAMSPLSSLFIVAHFFVDYIFENPDWTNKKFLERFKSDLSGSHFTKVMKFFET